MKKINFKNSNGITLIALVISIIVMLILANVSINAIMGENGIIAQARDARLMTELSNELFKLESDIVSSKIAHKGQKMPTRVILSEVDDVSLFSQSRGNGVNHAELRLNSSTLEDMHIALNGDVYLNNYKRAKIALSELINTIEFDDGTKATAIDAEINQKSNGFISIKNNLYSGIYMDNEKKIQYGNYDVIWTDENEQIVSISKEYNFYPIGFKDYEILNYPIMNLESMHQFIENRYLINCSSEMRYDAAKKRYFVEADVFHYLEDTNLNLGQTRTFEVPAIINDEETSAFIQMGGETKVGGTTITGIELLLSADTSFSRRYSASVTDTWANYTTDSYEVKQYYFNLTEENIKQIAKALGVNRLYYTVLVKYRAWAYNRYNEETEKTSRYYYVTEDSCYTDAFKYIDV